MSRRGEWRLVLLVAALPVLTYPSNFALPSATAPPIAHTGGFGEPTCRRCHGDHAVNEPPGVLELTGLPASYVPNRKYRLLVSLHHPTLARAGFQLSARLTAPSAKGTQAGQLLPADSTVRVVVGGLRTVQYAQHARAPSMRTTRVQWSVVWVAPAPGSGPVIVHAAANASNDDDSELGDRIYTGVWQSHDSLGAR